MTKAIDSVTAKATEAMNSRITQVTKSSHSRWSVESAAGVQRTAAPALERGDVLFFSDLAFAVEGNEPQAFSPRIVEHAKQVAFDPATGKVGGTTLAGDDLKALSDMLARFSRQAIAFVDSLLPSYRGRLAVGRTSFRPVEIAGRKTSWRKDDTRLHVDSFPSSPVQGSRILRVFTNVNPEGRARTWRIGEDFETMARRFAPALRAPVPGTSAVLHWLHVTKTRRTVYDAMMLQLHDRMKADLVYQRDCPQTTVEFPVGSTWVVFTDQVSHAAMAGQFQLEQTFLLPVDAMQEEWRSPLRVLERLKGRSLAPSSTPTSALPRSRPDPR